jgi:demethylmenaquinone methyltransferase/2-methoxy-6-polyprenyl-1,4-benzoquinol methylase
VYKDIAFSKTNINASRFVRNQIEKTYFPNVCFTQAKVKKYTFFTPYFGPLFRNLFFLWILFFAFAKLYICQKIRSMSKKVTPYTTSEQSKKEQVEQMFDTISGEYDGLNRVISLGIDVKWRKKVVQLVAATSPDSVLDIATGTGDLIINMTTTSATRLVGLDISEGMLDVGRKKINAAQLNTRIEMMQADSEAMPFEDNSFDAITVAFGVRNFETLEKGLGEIRRVLKPGGIFVILETSVPTKFPFKQGYKFYSRFILPAIGRMFSKDRDAYKYLSESASVFPFGEALNNILRKTGFKDVEDKPQTFGVATIYTASK